MIPSVVASEVTGALRDFLATGFGPSNPALANVVDDFLAEPGNLAKGPYLSIALPFQPAPEGGEPFPEVPLGFTPYRRQRIAFSDNVQDAAHRGGFFSARTWRNSVRAAVAQVVAAHDGIALANLPVRVEGWWRDARTNPGAFESDDEALRGALASVLDKED